ncbi:DUF2358 domain-containing protein [Leptolyngbya sp. PCC 6406]|uniref:DUF2358 domain-containing protein n=1 Tax=Leptolyngbya sp. PCC 6406 TaxID=1173264 RepID=UPI0002ABCF8E|nr:DUF2358 domain-containing protein [Leptolyngbya sp. PCC 6406]
MNAEPSQVLRTVAERLRQDYAQFPAHQSYDLYAADVQFEDPLNRFQGVQKYQKMIGFIDRWFIDPTLDLHELICHDPDQIQTHWTLSWVAPLPWKPGIAISGWTDYRLNAEGQICAHIDHWHCSRLDVLKQVLAPRR